MRAGVALLLSAVWLTGCANHDASVPAACTQGVDVLEAALKSAPAPVHVGGARPSQCFAHAAGAADVQQVGANYVEAAQDLADRARAQPHSSAATQLGYLVGVVRKGAGRGFGVYYEAHRRVEDELQGVDTHAPEFVRGARAGQRYG